MRVARDARGRIAVAAFVAAEIGAAIVYIVNGRRVWFFGVLGDEWDFLAARRLTLHDLLLRHGDHLVALPALVFRLMYSTFGLRSYLPYQLLSIALHLTAAALLRVIMRRAGVDPWIATAAAALFALFGAGSQDILIAFQITFSGALVLGLTQLLLADHAGPIDRRDWLGLLAGLGSLLCSDVAIVMIATVALVMVMRRRWPAAVLHAAPLAAVYIAWSRSYGRAAHLSTRSFTRSVRTSISATFAALAQVPYLGWLIALVLVAGIAVALRDTIRSREPFARWSAIAAPLGLGIGAVLFAVFLGVARYGLDVRFAASSRYLHVFAALLLPAVAVAADALVRHSRFLSVPVLALLLVGIPGNVAKVADNIGSVKFYANQRRVVLSLAHDPLARRVPRDLHPAPSFAQPVTVGWLLDGARSGRIPSVVGPAGAALATERLRLSLEQLDGLRSTACRPLRGSVVRHLDTGDSFGIEGAVAVQKLGGSGPSSAPLPFGASLLATASTHTLRAVIGPLELRLSPLSRNAAIC